MKLNNILKIEVELLLERVKNVGQNTCVTATLLEGEKGAGKTYLTTTIAKMFCGVDWEKKYLFYQCNEGTTPAHFLYDIDVQGVVQSVSGDVNKIYLEKWIEQLVRFEMKENENETSSNITTVAKIKGKIKNYSANSPSTLSKGILVQACEMSQNQKVVLVIDELDKTPRSVDAFLLDFLQNFRVLDPIYGKVEGNKENCIVIFTSNAERFFSEPLYRRFVTVNIPYPDEKELVYRIKNNIVVPFDDHFLLETVKYVNHIRTLPNLFYKPTISEIMTLLLDLQHLVKRADEDKNYFVTRTLSPNMNDRLLIENDEKTKQFVKSIK